MKKILLSTTALAVASGFAFAEAKAADVSVGGYYNQYFFMADSEANFHGAGSSATDGEANIDEATFDTYQDAEIIFNATQKLDNGLTVAVQVQLEANDSGDRIDEVYMTVSGNFGQIIVGSENYPNYKMGVWTPSVSSLGIESGDIQGIVGATTNSTDVAYGSGMPRASFNDSQGISYYSPNIAGFQVGVGFAPESSQTSSYPGPNANAVLENGLNGAVTWNGDLEGLGISAGVGGWSWRGTTAKGSIGQDDGNWGAQGGLVLSMDGFSVGANYARSGGMLNETESATGEAMSVGISYSSGPWGVSAQYLTGTKDGLREANGPMNLQDSAQGWEVAGNYSLGQGVGVMGSIFGYEQDGEDVENGNTTDSFDAIGGAVGIEFSF